MAYTVSVGVPITPPECRTLATFLSAEDRLDGNRGHGGFSNGSMSFSWNECSK